MERIEAVADDAPEVTDGAGSGFVQERLSLANASTWRYGDCLAGKAVYANAASTLAIC